jgi:hypothetical protein
VRDSLVMGQLGHRPAGLIVASVITTSDTVAWLAQCA